MVDKLNLAIVNSDKGELDAVGFVNAQYDIALDLLNNNTSSKKYAKKDIEELPLAVITAIIREISDFVRGADSNPN